MTSDPRLINEDLRPTKPEQRTWSLRHIAALWVGMAVCIPTYMLASDLMNGGATLRTAVVAIALGNLVVLVPLVLNAHPGTKYGIPFPVLLRASFGVLGANIPALMRAVVACGWFGINTYFGGIAIAALAGVVFPASWTIPEVLPGWFGISTGAFLAYFLFWAIQVAVIVRGMESVKVLESWAAPFLLAVGCILFGWAYGKVGTLSVLLGDSTATQAGADTFSAGINGAVAFWGTLALNIPDFSRFAKSQRDQIWGQAIALPPTMTFYAFIGAAVTNATIVLYGTAIGNPIELMAKIGGPWVALMSMFTLALATLSTNLAANIVSPANDISNLAPHKISFRKGAVVAAFVGCLFLPWKLADSVMQWLSAYGAVLGAVGGIMIADYYLVRRTVLRADELYCRGGTYEYVRGFNPIAFVALTVAIGINVPGMLQNLGFLHTSAFFSTIYSWGWFVSFSLAGALYWLGMRLFDCQTSQRLGM